MRDLVGCTLLAASLNVLGACAGEDASLTAHVTPEAQASAPHPISVFGVFRDGRMSTKGWDDFSPRLGVLGLEPCGALYDADLVTNDSALVSAIDDYARNYGVTDTLLGAFGASAKADLLLVIVVSGALPSKHASSEPSPARAPPGPGMSRSSRGAYVPRAAPHHDTGALEISASLFSTRLHTAVAAVALRYTGSSENDAIAKIDAKLKDVFPHASCAGWDLETHPVDAATVRSLPED
jgi:hypothetical protein